MDTKLYTIPEVATVLRVSRQMIYNLLNENKIGHVVIGGMKRISQDQIDKFLSDNRVEKEDK